MGPEATGGRFGGAERGNSGKKQRRIFAYTILYWELIVSGEVAGAAAREGRKGKIPGTKKRRIFAYIILY